MRSHKLCDVTKVAACGTEFTGMSGRVGEISGSFICHAARGWPSASKIEAGILSKFEPNLDHPGGK